jgi:hypothetical protein
MDVASAMVLVRSRLGIVPDVELAVLVGVVGIGGHAEARYARVTDAGPTGVKDIEVTVVGIVRMEGEAEQSLFAVRIVHPIGDVEKDPRGPGPVRVQDVDAALAFDHKEPGITRARNGHRLGTSTVHQLERAGDGGCAKLNADIRKAGQGVRVLS